MTVEIEGEKCYVVSEVSQLSGVSKSTINRWLHDGIVTCGKLRIHNGWRFFTEEDIAEIKSEFERVCEESE